VFLVLATAALADPTSRLAPGPGELSTAQAELEGRLVVAEAVGVAVARLQGAHTNLTGKGTPCEDPVRAQSLARLRHFADRWHDAIQRVSVQAERLRWTAAAPTVEPIVDEERQALIRALITRSTRLESQWLETWAWFQATAPRVCRESALTSFAGLPPPAIQAADEVTGATAVTAVSGFVCPERGSPVEPAGDLVLLSGRACWSESAACDCQRVDTWPGAVLGPEPPEAPPPVAGLEASTDPGAPAAEVEEAGPGVPAEPQTTADPLD
jgi:hypothetical protein